MQLNDQTLHTMCTCPHCAGRPTVQTVINHIEKVGDALFMSHSHSNAPRNRLLAAKGKERVGGKGGETYWLP